MPRRKRVELPIRGLYRPTSINISEGEREYLREVADRYNISVHGLMRFLFRWGLRELMAGKIRLEEYVEEPKAPPKARLRDLNISN